MSARSNGIGGFIVGTGFGFLLYSCLDRGFMPLGLFCCWLLIFIAWLTGPIGKGNYRESGLEKPSPLSDMESSEAITERKPWPKV